MTKPVKLEQRRISAPVQSNARFCLTSRSEKKMISEACELERRFSKPEPPNLRAQTFGGRPRLPASRRASAVGAGARSDGPVIRRDAEQTGLVPVGLNVAEVASRSVARGGRAHTRNPPRHHAGADQDLAVDGGDVDIVGREPLHLSRLAVEVELAATVVDAPGRDGLIRDGRDAALVDELGRHGRVDVGLDGRL